MQSIYEASVYADLVNRVNKLSPETVPQWGKMNVAQMMEHCARAFDYATGKIKEPRMLMGILLGAFFKASYYNDKPWPRNSPTAKVYLVTNEPEFAATKNRLLAGMKEFYEGGPAKATTHPSPFFGHLTPEQHGYGQFKHLDHHLTQFGV